MRYIILCFVNVILMVTGQMLFRTGAYGRSFDSIIAIFKVVSSPIVIAGLFVYAITTVLWLYILSKVPISFAYPIQALAIPLVLIMANFVLRESVPPTRWIGAGIIFVGLILVTR